MPAAASISWREPTWSFRPRYIAEFADSGLFTFRFWLRVYAITVLVVGAAILAAYLALPNFHLPPQVFTAPLIMPTFIALRFGAFYFFPPTINISPQRIGIVEGSSAFAIDRTKPLAATINADDPDFPTLTLRYTTRRGKERTRIYGIASHIDLVQLHDMLSASQPRTPSENPHARTL